jgi:HEAT repeat protein
LAFNISSEPALRVALAIGLAAFAATLALVVQVGVMRMVQRRRDAAAVATRDRWRPLLLRHAMGEAVALPALATSQQAVFLLLWNQIADSLRGPSHDLLRSVILQLDLQTSARRWLVGRNARRQLLGVLTLGHLGSSVDGPDLRRRLGDPRTYMSIAAARALLQVDAARAVDPVLDELARRPDWPTARLAGMLRGAGAEHVYEPLLRRLQQDAATPSPQVVRLLAAVDAVRASPTLVHLMQRSDDTELLSTCLQHVQTPDGLPRVRELARHPLWWMRVQAAAALGRLGDQEDRALLLALLTDKIWWVRYRAAIAFVRMPGLTPDAVAALGEGLGDPYARDILRQALAEASVA